MPARGVRAGGLVGPGCLPSAGRSTSLPSRVCMRSLIGHRAARPAPLSPGTLRLHRHVERPFRATRPSLAALASAADIAERCVSPTSTTDLQHEHPRIRWTPTQLRNQGPRHRAPLGDPQPRTSMWRRREASSARVRGRLTPSSQLQPSSRRPPRFAKGSASPDRRFAAAACSAVRNASKLDL